MNEGKKANTIIALLAVVIVALVVIAAVMGGRMNALESQVSMLQNEVVNVPNQVYGQLAGYIDTALKQSQGFVESTGITYGGIDESAKTVKVRLSFRLKESMKGTVVKAYPIPVNAAAQPGDGYSALSENGVDYISEFPLSWQEDFNVDIFQTDASGNSRKLNAESIPVFVKNDFGKKTNMAVYNYQLSPDGVKLDGVLENRTFGYKGFQIKNVELILWDSGMEAARMDITDKSLIDSKDIEKYTLMATAGDSNIANELPSSLKTGKVQMDPEGTERGYYLLTIEKERIKQTSEMTCEYVYTVEITYENGDVFKTEAEPLGY